MTINTILQAEALIARLQLLLEKDIIAHYKEVRDGIAEILNEMDDASVAGTYDARVRLREIVSTDAFALRISSSLISRVLAKLDAASDRKMRG